MPLPSLSAEQRQRLDQLKAADWSGMSDTQRKMFQRLLGLLGETGSHSASDPDGKPSSVSNFIKRLKNGGLDYYLEKWETSLKRSELKTRAVPGPKGLNSVDQWIQNAPDYVGRVLEIAWMLAAPRLHILIFAIRNERSETPDQPLYRPFFFTVRQILDRPPLEEVHWTRLCVFDVHLRSWLYNLEGKTRIFEEQGVGLRQGALIPNPFAELRRNWPSEYRFHVIVGGELAKSIVDGWMTEEANGGPRFSRTAGWDAKDYFPRLSSLLYRLRLRHSGPGFLPCNAVLAASAEEWATSERCEPFCFEAEPEYVKKKLQSSPFIHRFASVFGGLYYMEDRMRRVLPGKADFPLEVLGIRPRVEVDPHPCGRGFQVGIQMVPGLGCSFDLVPDWDIDMDRRKVAAEIRARLRGKNAVPRFGYSNRSSGPLGWENLIHPAEGDRALTRSGEIPAVLLPRHFIVTDEGIDIAAIVHSSQSLEEGVFTKPSPEDDGLGRELVFHAPQLVAFIRKTYESNLYGDAIHWHHSALQRAARELRKSSERWPDLSFLNLHRPSYWWFDQAGGGREYQTRVRAIVAWRRSLHESGQPSSTALQFADSAEDGLRELLRDLDADFLLLHLPARERAVVDQLALSWSEEIKRFIRRGRDVDDGQAWDQMDGVAEIAGRRLGKEKSDLTSAVYDALESFGKYCLRVDRKAVEMVQRCALANLTPVALVIEREENILRSWRWYLRLRLRSLLRPRSEATWGPELDMETSADFAVESMELMALVERLVETGGQEDLVRSFFDEVEHRDYEIWLEVLAGLTDAGVQAAVRDSLTIVGHKDKRDEPREKRIQAVMTRFASLPAR